jgi:hypothetical protein
MSDQPIVYKPAAEAPTSELMVSSARLVHVGSHDRVTIWNRGACAGELVLQEGDGVRLMALLRLAPPMS